MVNDVIKSRWRSSVKKRIKTLTSPAGEAFVVTTEINMSAQIRLCSSTMLIQLIQLKSSLVRQDSAVEEVFILTL